MPTYEYSCNECGEQLEVVQSIHDDSLTQCPQCGGALRKIFGNVGVVFKGSGFYKTDSREKKSAPTKSAAGKVEKTDAASPPSASGDTDAAPTKTGSDSASGAGTSGGSASGGSSTPSSASGSGSSSATSGAK